jgi:cell division protein FtsL
LFKFVLINFGGNLKFFGNFLFSSSNYDWQTLFGKFKDWTRERRWRLFGIIALTALVTVIIVSNVRAVNRMLVSVRQLEKQEKQIINHNKVLQKQVNELESPERITPLAKNKFGMVQNEEFPKMIKVPKED